jgi:hypothetical protein
VTPVTILPVTAIAAMRAARTAEVDVQMVIVTVNNNWISAEIVTVAVETTPDSGNLPLCNSDSCRMKIRRENMRGNVCVATRFDE